MLFTETQNSRAYEKMMRRIPGFRPRGYGVMILYEEEYTAESIDCNLCCYMKEGGGCALAKCFCIEERIKAGFVPQSEALIEALSGAVYTPLLLRLKNEREVKTLDFYTCQHQTVFSKTIQKQNKGNYALAAALYLLTVNDTLWNTVRYCVSYNRISFNEIKIQNSSEYIYTLLCAAKDLYLGTKYMPLKDLADKDIVSSKAFQLICNAMAIRRFGLGAIQFHFHERSD